MGWVAAGLLFFLLGITPVRLGAAIQAEPRAGVAVTVGAMVWGTPLQARWTLAGFMNGEGWTLRCLGLLIPLRPRPGGGKAGKALLKGLLRSAAGRGLLRRFLRGVQVRGVVRVGGGDASAVAVLTGAVRGLAAGLGWGQVACVPALGGEGALRLHLSASARLGALCLAALLFAMNRRREGSSEWSRAGHV